MRYRKDMEYLHVSCIMKVNERSYIFMLDNFLIQLFHEGKCMEAYKVFGAHPEEI